MLVFIFLFLFFGSVSVSSEVSRKSLDRKLNTNWEIGGPAAKIIGEEIVLFNEQTDLELAAVFGTGIDFNNGIRNKNILFDKSAVVGSSNPLSDFVPMERGLRMYGVRDGDTITGIAARFGISADTIRWANSNIGRNLIKPGDKLIILPVSGILYEIQEGDTLQIVANRFQTNPEFIKKHNPDYPEMFNTSFGTIVLPYAEPLAPLSYAAMTAGLPDLGTYFSLPAEGWNWGELHHHNAIDIANSCGSPVFAAADGLVVSDDRLGDGSRGWNGGYGIFVFLEHPNGTRTRYAHLMRSLVNLGDYVYRGEKIGLMGNTGNTHGPSGCHLHFEVYGARNPFALR